MLSIPQPRLYLDRMGGIGFRTHVGRLWVNLVATGRFIAFCRSPVSAIQHDRARNLYQENPSYKYDRTLLLLKPSLGPQLLSSDGLCSRLVKAFAKRRCEAPSSDVRSSTKVHSRLSATSGVSDLCVNSCERLNDLLEARSSGSIISHGMASAAKTGRYCAFSSNTSVGLTSNANR